MKKERRGLNVIDVVIILLLIALVGTAGYRIYTEVTGGGIVAQSNIVLTFEAQVDDEGIVNYLKEGNTVYFTTDKSQLGRLYDKDAEDGKGPVFVIESDDDEKITLSGSLTLVADARKASGREYYVINGRNISVGSKLDVYTENAVLKITVKSIEAPTN